MLGGDSQHRTGCGGGLQSSLSRSPTVENGAWPRKQEFVLNHAGNSPPPSVFFGPRRFYAKSDFLYRGLKSCVFSRTNYGSSLKRLRSQMALIIWSESYGIRLKKDFYPPRQQLCNARSASFKASLSDKNKLPWRELQFGTTSTHTDAPIPAR